MIMIKYPETFAEIGRQNMTLAANSKIRPLEQSDFQNGESPLKAYKPWSVLSLNIANGESKSGGSGAIEITHLADVKIRTMIAMQEIMENERKGIKNSFNEQNSDNAASLLETKIYFIPREISNDMRGKSAFEIAQTCTYEVAQSIGQNLRKSAENNPKYKAANLKQAEAIELAGLLVASEKTILAGKSIKDWFSGNMDVALRVCQEEYTKGNSAVMIAMILKQVIDKDASVLQLLKGTPEIKKNMGNFKIYGPILKTPNVKKIDANGYTKAYSLAIWCNPEQNPYPFHVELQTMLGKPLTNRQVGVDGSSIINRKTFSIDLTTWEWMNIIDRADWEAKLVALWNHNDQYSAMVRAVDENRASANQAQSTVNQYQQPFMQSQYTQNSYTQYQQGYASRY